MFLGFCFGVTLKSSSHVEKKKIENVKRHTVDLCVLSAEAGVCGRRDMFRARSSATHTHTLSFLCQEIIIDGASQTYLRVPGCPITIPLIDFYRPALK